MKHSMWTSYFAEWDPRTTVACLAERGWPAAELSDEHAHDLLAEGPPLKAGEDLRRFAADHGVELTQGHFFLSTERAFKPGASGAVAADIAPADDKAFEQAMDTMKRWVDLFQALQIRAGVLHAGGGKLRQAGWSEHRIFERRVEAVSRVAQYAEGGPTVICLENLPGADRGSAVYEGLAAIIDAVGSDNLGICLDTGHANLTGVDQAAFIRSAGPRLKALHIADNLGVNDDHLLPYGPGQVPWPQVMTALREVGYDGLFNFEVPGERKCPEPVRLLKLDYALRLAEWMIAEESEKP